MHIMVPHVYFFLLSFTYGSESGLAIVIASSERQAFQCLKSQGRYSSAPALYSLVRVENVGAYYEGGAYGLMLESYTNAVVAFDALCAVMKDIVGPPGPQGPEGVQGPKGDKGDSVDAYTRDQIDTMMAAKQNLIADLAAIRSGANAGATAVQPSELSAYAKTADVASTYETKAAAALLEAELINSISRKQDTLVSGQNIKTINGESILGGGNIVAGDPNAVKYTEQTLTDAQKTQARTNIGAGTVNSYEVQNVSPADQYVSTELRSLLTVAPKMVVRKTSVFDDETFETSSSSNIYVSHPLMNYSGAEVVLMSYAKKNQHRLPRDNDEGNSITKSKKGFCIATMIEDVDGDPSMINEYFTFSPVTSAQELFDFLEQNTFGAEQGTPFLVRPRRYGIALRIPNPQYDGPASWNKNNTYRGVPESLYSDILEVYIGCNFERDDDTNEVISWSWGIGIK